MTFPPLRSVPGCQSLIPVTVGAVGLAGTGSAARGTVSPTGATQDSGTHSASGKSLQARKGCRRTHLWGEPRKGGMAGHRVPAWLSCDKGRGTQPPGSWGHSARPQSSLSHPPGAGDAPTSSGRCTTAYQEAPRAEHKLWRVQRNDGDGFSGKTPSSKAWLSQSSLLPTLGARPPGDRSPAECPAERTCSHTTPGCRRCHARGVRFLMALL